MCQTGQIINVSLQSMDAAAAGGKGLGVQRQSCTQPGTRILLPTACGPGATPSELLNLLGDQINYWVSVFCMYEPKWIKCVSRFLAVKWQTQ